MRLFYWGISRIRLTKIKKRKKNRWHSKIYQTSSGHPHLIKSSSAKKSMLLQWLSRNLPYQKQSNSRPKENTLTFMFIFPHKNYVCWGYNWIKRKMTVSMCHRLPGFSDFLLVGLIKIGTIGPDFQASRPRVTGFLALYKLSKVQPNNFSSFKFFLFYWPFLIFLKFFLVFCPCAPSPRCPISICSVTCTPLPMCPITPVPHLDLCIVKQHTSWPPPWPPTCYELRWLSNVSNCQKDIKVSKRCQVVKSQKVIHMDYGGGSQKSKLTWWGSQIMTSILTSHIMVTKDPQNVHRKYLWLGAIHIWCQNW